MSERLGTPPFRRAKINWWFLLLGVMCLIGAPFMHDRPIEERELITKTITVRGRVNSIKARDAVLRLGAVQYPCSFTVPTGGAAASKDVDVYRMTAGDVLTIGIGSWDAERLMERSTDVPIYTMTVNGRAAYDIRSYNEKRKVLDGRIQALAWIMGVALLLGSLWGSVPGIPPWRKH